MTNFTMPQTIEETKAQLERWLDHGRRFIRHPEARKYRITIEGPGYGDPEAKTLLREPQVRLRIWTRDHSYSIGARPPYVDHKQGDEGYLGCTMSNRAPLPGEEHTRGSDLADGPFSEDTWRAILLDIISYEALEVFETPKATPVGSVA